MEYETNTSITETHVQTDIRWDPGYVKTIPGVLKGVAVVGTIQICPGNYYVVSFLDIKFDKLHLCDVCLTIL